MKKMKQSDLPTMRNYTSSTNHYIMFFEIQVETNKLLMCLNMNTETQFYKIETYCNMETEIQFYKIETYCNMETETKYETYFCIKTYFHKMNIFALALTTSDNTFTKENKYFLLILRYMNYPNYKEENVKIKNSTLVSQHSKLEFIYLIRLQSTPPPSPLSSSSPPIFSSSSSPIPPLLIQVRDKMYSAMKPGHFLRKLKIIFREQSMVILGNKLTN